MRRLITAICALVFGAGLIFHAPPAMSADAKLQGEWTAAKAERDGMPAADVVGHRLSLSGERFQIHAKDGKLVYGGAVRLDSSAKPAAIDFDNKEGIAKGQAWKGIYTLDGDTLTIIDNAPDPSKPRPASFEAKSGSGYVLVTFRRGGS